MANKMKMIMKKLFNKIIFEIGSRVAADGISIINGIMTTNDTTAATSDTLVANGTAISDMPKAKGIDAGKADAKEQIPKV